MTQYVSRQQLFETVDRLADSMGKATQAALDRRDAEIAGLRARIEMLEGMKAAKPRVRVPARAA